MTIPTTTTGHPTTVTTEGCAPIYRTLSWRAIIAGTVAGLAVHLLFTLLGLGLGVGLLDPITDESPAVKLGIGATLAWCISALIALWVGGWVAGRFAPANRGCGGWLHGFLVWSLATVAVLYFATSTVGMLVGGTVKVLGQAAKPVAAAASGVTDLAKEAIKQNSDAIDSYLDEAIQLRGENGTPGSEVRAKREIGYALAQLFAPGADVKAPEKRTAVVRALTEAGVSEADANRLLNEWTASYERMKADLQAAKDKAEQKAREAGETASKAVSRAAVWTFLAFLLGAVVASLGGKCGAACSRTHDDEPRRA